MNFTRRFLLTLMVAACALTSAVAAQTCPPLALTPHDLPAGTLGMPYRQAITASGGVGAYQLTVVRGALPPGLRLERDGVLMGTPTQLGGERFTLNVTYILNGCSVHWDYVLEINPPPPCLTVTPPSVPNGKLGVAYRQVVTVTGGTPPYTFAINIRSKVPPGLSFINGVLSGTPTQVGTFNFGGTLRDASGCERDWGYTMTINPAIAFVSAASYQPEVAPESIVAAFGEGLAPRTQAASGLPLPTELAGTQVRLRDSQGVERLAPLFFVSPGQINLQIPAGMATGVATATLSNGLIGTLAIAPVAPSLFTANADGRGVPAAVLLRVRNGVQSFEPVARLEGNRFVPAPLLINSADEQLFLVLFGTGMRIGDRGIVTIGGLTVRATYSGPATGLAGVDQVNVPLPIELRGRGDLDVVVQVGRMDTNTVRIFVR
jgi:uncharacterized protein (TIGR03437 family)